MLRCSSHPLGPKCQWPRPEHVFTALVREVLPCGPSPSLNDGASTLSTNLMSTNAKLGIAELHSGWHGGRPGDHAAPEPHDGDHPRGTPSPGAEGGGSSTRQVHTVQPLPEPHHGAAALWKPCPPGAGPAKEAHDRQRLRTVCLTMWGMRPGEARYRRKVSTCASSQPQALQVDAAFRRPGCMLHRCTERARPRASRRARAALRCTRIQGTARLQRVVMTTNSRSEGMAL